MATPICHRCRKLVTDPNGLVMALGLPFHDACFYSPPPVRDPIPVPTDFGIYGPFSVPWTWRTWMWFALAIASAAAFIFCLAFTLGAVLTSKGLL